MKVPGDLASATWANCGPAAIAAAHGMNLSDVREVVSKNGRFPGYMGIRDIQRACDTLGRPLRATASKPGAPTSWPPGIYLAMVNITGPWSRDSRSQARHRHIVAPAWGQLTWRVYDVNANEWLPLAAWSRLVMDPLAEQHEGSTGWEWAWRGKVCEA